MKLRGTIATLLAILSLTFCVLTPARSAGPAIDANAPRLGDIMTAIQLRHLKLWFAGKAQNWELAAYELRQIRAGLENAAALYPGLPVSNVTTMAAPVDTLAVTIDAKDRRRFSAAFGELTAACNACHLSVDRGFVAIQVPATSPFGNQSFAPAKP